MEKYNVAEYPVIVRWSQEDDRFLAEIPQLPGCMSDGHTEEEARANILVIARDWIKMAQYLGREVPVPTPLTYAC